MIEIGRLCVKIAGREAGKKCVVVDVIDKNYVLVDGELRRKKCSISHLEPLDKKIELKKKASHSDVVSEFKKLKIEVRERKKKERKERPRKQRGKKKVKAEEKTKEKVKKEKTAKKDAKKKDIEAKLEK